jgi:hypothetical protein
VVNLNDGPKVWPSSHGKKGQFGGDILNEKGSLGRYLKISGHKKGCFLLKMQQKTA